MIKLLEKSDYYLELLRMAYCFYYWELTSGVNKKKKTFCSQFTHIYAVKKRCAVNYLQERKPIEVDRSFLKISLFLLFLFYSIFSHSRKLGPQKACKYASFTFLVYVRLYFPKRVLIIMSVWELSPPWKIKRKKFPKSILSKSRAQNM